MKLNMKVFIVLVILASILIVSICLCYIFRQNFKNKYNNYKIEVIAIKSGVDEFGNNLNETRKKYEFSIKENMPFYETYSNEWITTNNENVIGEIMSIKKINIDNIIIEVNGSEFVIKYGDKNIINSLMFISDGLNCTYEYKIIH